LFKKNTGIWIIQSLLILIIIVSFTNCSLFEGEQFDLKHRVYVPNLGDATISVIPAENSLNTELIDVRRSIRMIAKHPNSDVLLVLVAGTNEIVRIDTRDNTVTDTFRFEAGAPSAQVNNWLVFNPSGTKAYLTTSYQPAGIAVMNLSNYSFNKGINVNSTSIEKFIFASNDRMYATDPERRYIYEINTTTDEWQREIQVPETFGYTIYNTRTQRFLMAGMGTNPEIKEFDPVHLDFPNRVSNVTDRIVKLLISPNENLLYVLGNSEIVTINLNNFVIRERVPLTYQNPSDFRFLPDNSFILIPSLNSRSVMVIKPDNLEMETTINTGTNPGEIAIINDGQY
jgi:hypothetical protein